MLLNEFCGAFRTRQRFSCGSWGALKCYLRFCSAYREHANRAKYANGVTRPLTCESGCRNMMRMWLMRADWEHWGSAFGCTINCISDKDQKKCKEIQYFVSHSGAGMSVQPLWERRNLPGPGQRLSVLLSPPMEGEDLPHRSVGSLVSSLENGQPTFLQTLICLFLQTPTSARIAPASMPRPAATWSVDTSASACRAGRTRTAIGVSESRLEWTEQKYQIYNTQKHNTLIVLVFISCRCQRLWRPVSKWSHMSGESTSCYTSFSLLF